MYLRDIVKEAGKRASGVVAHVLELGHQLVPQLLVDYGHLDIRSSQVGSLTHSAKSAGKSHVT